MIRLRKPQTSVSDEALMVAAAAGSDQAFEAIYRRYARRLQGFFFRQTGGDEALAADMTHDVFLQAWQARRRYRNDCRVSAWLFTMAYNLCRNLYRHRQAEEAFRAQLDAEPVDDGPAAAAIDSGLRDEALREVLRSLPPSMHLLFSLHYEEELSLAEMADLMQVPEGTVKSRLSRTMNYIRKQLQQYE